MSKEEKLGLLFLIIGAYTFQDAKTGLEKIAVILLLGVGYFMFMYGDTQ